MAEDIQEQISAFVDGELSADESEFLVRRLNHDQTARTTVARYSLIGASIRDELMVGDPDALCRRIATSLDGQPDADVKPIQSSQGWFKAVRPVAALGAAASVALAVLFVIGDGGPPGSAPIADSTTFATVPDNTVETRFVAPPIRLTNYLVSHGQYAPSIGRQLVSSNVVGYRPADQVDSQQDDRQTNDDELSE